MFFKVLRAIKILENYIAYQHDTTWLFECANTAFGYRFHTDSTSNSFDCKRSILTSNSGPCPFISAHLKLVFFFFVLITMASHPSSVAAFLDGHSVPVVVNSHLATSFYPPAWHRSSPVHVACRYSDGFTFAALVTLIPSAAIQCLVVGHDWSNSVVVSCGRFSLYFFLPVVYCPSVSGPSHRLPEAFG